MHNQPQPTNQEPTRLVRITHAEFELIQAHRQNSNPYTVATYQLLDADELPILDAVRRKAYRMYLAASGLDPDTGEQT